MTLPRPAWNEVNAAPQVRPRGTGERSGQAGPGRARQNRLIPRTAVPSWRRREAAVRQAQAQVDLLKAGAARKQEIAAAEAGVTQAEAGLRQAQAALNDTELRAPFGGVVAVLERAPGRAGDAGAPVAEMGDLGV